MDTHYICQRCMQPLNVQSDLLENIDDEHIRAELTLPTNRGSHHKKHERFHPPSREQLLAQGVHITEPFNVLADVKKRATTGFTFLEEDSKYRENSTEASNIQDNTFSRKERTLAEIFDIMSNNGLVDHPMCESCTENLMEAFTSELKMLQSENVELKEFLKEIEVGDSDDDVGVGDIDLLEKQLNDLELEKDGLRTELSELQAEIVEAESALHKEMVVKRELETEEDKYWDECAQFKHKMCVAMDEQRSMDNKMKYYQSRIEYLQNLNIFDVVFQIQCTPSNPIASINNLRLGRLPGLSVEWLEINAAWGQAALLILALAREVFSPPDDVKVEDCNLFQRFQIIPYGQISYVKSKSEPSRTLPLYGQGGLRLLSDAKFDQGMVAFLDCVNQIATHIDAKHSFCVPYAMDSQKGKICSRGVNTSTPQQAETQQQWLSIKLQFNSEESWTKAMKLMMTNLKWILAFVSSKHMGRVEKEMRKEISRSEAEMMSISTSTNTNN